MRRISPCVRNELHLVAARSSREVKGDFKQLPSQAMASPSLIDYQILNASPRPACSRHIIQNEQIQRAKNTVPGVVQNQDGPVWLKQYVTKGRGKRFRVYRLIFVVHLSQ